MASIVLPPQGTSARQRSRAQGDTESGWLPAAAASRAWLAASAVVGLAALAYALAIAFGLADSLLRVEQDHALAFFIDLAVLMAFTLHFHHVLRPGARFAYGCSTRSVPRLASALLQSSALLVFAFGLWQPLPQSVWTVVSPLAAAWMWTGYALGWTLLLWGERKPAVLVAGLCLVEWCVPGMSLGHLVFAVGLTAFAFRYRGALAELARGNT